MWDKDTTFSNRQLLVEGESDHRIDTGGDDYGLGNPVYLQVALTPGCTGTLSVNLDSSDNPGMGDATRVVQYIVPEDRVAKGGIVLAAPLPTGCKRYLRLTYAGAGNGRVTAGLAAGAQTSALR